MKRFASFWLLPVLAVGLLGLSFQAEPARGARDLVLPAAIGIIFWTLLEYVLHRFLFHVRIPVRNPVLRKLLSSSHLEHHAAPRNPGVLLVHPAYALVVSSGLYGLLYVLTRSVFSAAGVLTGIWAGFLYYEAVHYRVHFSLAANGVIARRRRPHFYHHFTDNRRCFGVTTTLWDYVFGTAQGPGKLRN